MKRTVFETARYVAVATTIGLAAASTVACDALMAVLPALAFCGDDAKPSDLAKLAEGPALFVDAVRTITAEVGEQSESLGTGLTKGISVNAKVLEALGPYQYGGNGTYTRAAAADRQFRARFYYGTGVEGKTPDQPLEADLARLESYVPNILNPTGTQGPLYPLLDSVIQGLATGRLGLKDEALRFDVGSLLATTLKGYDLKLGLATNRSTVRGIIEQLEGKKLGFSLADTSMEQKALGFTLAVKKFDMTMGLDGKADMGGDYLFQVTNGTLNYFGAVKTVSGLPVLSLRCTEAPGTEWGTVSFASSGKADFKVNAENFPITLPGLAPLLTP